MVTMITVGYGEIVAQTNVEIMLSIITMLITCGIFAYCIGAIGNILQELQQKEKEQKTKLYIINNFMKKKKIDQNLQNNIREYLEYVWSQVDQQETQIQDDIISSLSTQLKRQILLDANKILLKHSNIFKGFSDNLITKTIPIIEELNYPPGTLIYDSKMQNNKHAIYFIDDGAIEVNSCYDEPNQNKILTLNRGQCFGSFEFFCEEILYKVKYRSINYVRILKVEREPFLQLAKQFTFDFERFQYIKDKLLFSQDYNFEGIYTCKSCKSEQHTVIDCPYVHFIPNRYIIQVGSNINFPQKRQEFSRKYELKYHPTLKQENYLMECSIEFINKKQQEINEYVSNYINFIESDDSSFSTNQDTDYQDPMNQSLYSTGSDSSSQIQSEVLNIQNVIKEEEEDIDSDKVLSQQNEEDSKDQQLLEIKISDHDSSEQNDKKNIITQMQDDNQNEFLEDAIISQNNIQSLKNNNEIVQNQDSDKNQNQKNQLQNQITEKSEPISLFSSSNSSIQSIQSFETNNKSIKFQENLDDQQNQQANLQKTDFKVYHQKL